MSRMILFYVTCAALVRDTAERAQRRYDGKDRGASMVEYAALIVLAGAIFVALDKAGIISTVKDKTSQAISDLFSK